MENGISRSLAGAHALSKSCHQMYYNAVALYPSELSIWKHVQICVLRSLCAVVLWGLPCGTLELCVSHSAVRTSIMWNRPSGSWNNTPVNIELELSKLGIVVGLKFHFFLNPTCSFWPLVFLLHINQKLLSSFDTWKLYNLLCRKYFRFKEQQRKILS
jgi:hypothetical protein